MSKLWAKILEIAVPWLLEKVATLLARFIKQKKKDQAIEADQDAALERLKNAKTKEEVENAAKNSLGL